MNIIGGWGGWGGWGGGAYIRDVTYLGGFYAEGGLYTGGRINGILRYIPD